MRNVLLLELLFETQKIKFTTSAKSNRMRLGRQIAWATLASRVNQLGTEVTDRKIESTNAVVVEEMLDCRSRSVIRTCRQQRHLRGTRSVKLDSSSQERR